MSKSKIEWTDYTINFVSGCTKVSQGCKNCYAEKMHKRLQAIGVERYQSPFNEVNVWLEYLRTQLHKLDGKKNMKVFVNSMSDTFHTSVKIDELNRAFGMLKTYENSTFQILTKRVPILDGYTSICTTPKNVWFGISLCNNEDFYKNEMYLKDIKNNLKDRIFFVSFEPLLEDLDTAILEYHIKNTFDWIIVGGESGYKARPMNPDWVRKIRDLCIKYNKPFFFKQYSAYQNKNYKDNTLDGVKWEQFPGDANVSSM